MQQHTKYKWPLILWITILSYAAITGYYGLIRHWSLKTSLIDLGVFYQAIWTFINTGTPLTSINPPHEIINWLGFHFSPLVLIFAPVLYIVPDTESLLIIQSICFAVTAWPIYLIARHLKQSPTQSYLWALLTLLHPMMLAAGNWEFHEIALATPVLASAIFVTLAKRYVLTWIFCILLLLCKEHYGVALIGLGLIWGIRNQSWRRAVPLILAGTLAIWLIPFHLMPWLSGQQTHLMTHLGTEAQDRYAWLSLDIPTVFDLFIRGKLMAYATWQYLIYLLAPFFLTPLAAPVILLAGLAEFATNLLSANYLQTGLGSYHSAPLIPVLTTAAIIGHKYIFKTIPTTKLLLLMLLFTLILNIKSGSLPFAPNNFWEVTAKDLTIQKTDVMRLYTLLPPETKLTAQTNIGSNFANRKDIYPFPHRLEESDAILLHLYYPFQTTANAYYSSPYNMDWQDYIQTIRNLLNDKQNWHVSYWQNNWLLLKRTEPETTIPNEGITQRLNELEAQLNTLPTQK